MSGADQFTVRKQLVAVLKRKAEKAGMKLDQDCLAQLERLVGQGVERMALMKVLERPDKIMQAENAIDDLLESLKNQARQLGTFPQVGPKAFGMAKNDFCPHWPLC